MKEKYIPTTYKEKIEYSINLIRNAEKLALKYDEIDGFFLAFSGGKDSQVLYHLAKMAGVKFKSHMSMTSVDPPEVIKFVRKEYPDVKLHPPKQSIYKYAIEKQLLPSMRVRWCCAELKEQAGAGKVTLIGIRKEESSRRAKRNEVEVSSHKFSGDLDSFEKWQYEKIKKKLKHLNQDQFSEDKEHSIRCINGKDSIIVSPILYWTEKDVWRFLNENNIPYCSLYDKGYKRIGCILCPMSQKKQKIREMEDFPYVKKNWIRTIKKIRGGGEFANINTYKRCGIHCTSESKSLARQNRGIWAGFLIAHPLTA